MRSIKLNLLFVLVACVAACKGAGDAADSDGGAAGTTSMSPVCPQDVPASCPSPAPSYATTIKPLIAARCLTCHAPGGVADKIRDFSTWPSVYGARSDMLGRIYNCMMPPLGSPQLTATELRTIQAWFVCGAPNN